MKTSISNGKNLTKLDFNYMITYRPRISPSFDKREECIRSIFNNIPYNHLIYFWERDKEISNYHSHILVQSEFSEIIPCMFQNVNGVKSVLHGTRETLIKSQKTLTNPKSGEKIHKVMDRKVNIEFSEFMGTKGKVHFEPIIESNNSCYYVSKFSDRGIISGYLNMLVN
jgi:hypothetical protein